MKTLKLTKIIIALIVTLVTCPTAWAATYYVDKDNPSASDSNNGSEISPLSTIYRATTIAQTGDTIYVKAGTYNEGINLSKDNIHIEAVGDVYLLKRAAVRSNNCTVSGFDITDVAADNGIYVVGDGNLADGNTIHNTAQDGIWFFGSNNTFTNNYIYDILDPSIGGDPHVDCFQTWGWQRDTINVLFEGNVCEHTRATGSNQILMLERIMPEYEVRDITFKNNLFIMYDGGYSPMNFARKDGQAEISGMKVINNTFVHPYNIGQAGVAMLGITNGVIKNNIFYNNGDASQSYVNIVGGNVEVSNNLVYTTGVEPVGGPNAGDIWMKDPGFVSGFSGKGVFDFRISQDSPAIDAGASLGDVLLDKDGVSRPQQAAHDIGAYEFVDPVATTPAAPENLRLLSN